MTALTVRLPDEKYDRLKTLAKQRRTSVNRLLDEMTSLILAEADAEMRYLLRAKRGSGKAARGLELLAKAGRLEEPQEPAED